MRPLAAALISSVFLLSACSRGVGTPDASPTPAPAPTDAGIVGSATCEDEVGDIRVVDETTPSPDQPSGNDLTMVVLQADGEELTVSFESTSPVSVEPDGHEPVRWVVWILDGTDLLHQLRVARTDDGWETTFDAADRRVTVSEDPPEIDGKTMRVTYDLDDLVLLRPDFGWTALSTHGDPATQDVCPNAAETSLAPDVQLPFPDGSRR